VQAVTDISYIDSCLEKKVIFITGKGGVGKSTLAWATAMACQRKGKRVTVASWNPFDPYAGPLPENQGIRWLPLDTLSCFKEYVLHILKFEAIYNTVFDNHVLKSFVRAAPGLAETVIAGKIWDLYHRAEQDLLVVDLPSSGHALSFFQSPLGVQKIFAIGFVHKEAGKISDMFASASTRIDLVALPEELPLVESKQLRDKLAALHPFHFGFLFLNQCTPEFALPQTENVPEVVRECRWRYEERLQQEKDTLSFAEAIPLPKRRIPRFPSADLRDTLHQVAQHLERT
jgi:anion-transporting  ArsA/GET3 family ATPase